MSTRTYLICGLLVVFSSITALTFFGFNPLMRRIDAKDESKSLPVLPGKRIVAYYGNPVSKRMGVLGKYDKAEMLRMLDLEVAKWRAAAPETPVQPALHLIASMALDAPGESGLYRRVMKDELIKKVYGWAQDAGAIMFIDLQPGHENIRTLLPRFDWILKQPDVHLGIDPEFNMAGSKAHPGKKVGSFDAKDINFVSNHLQALVNKHKLPPKILVVHRFTRNGVTNSNRIEKRPDVQIVMHMDGWGAPGVKRNSYRHFIAANPVQYCGFKLFYKNDTEKGGRMMTPGEVLALNPKPLYIQYQ